MTDMSYNVSGNGHSLSHWKCNRRNCRNKN